MYAVLFTVKFLEMPGVPDGFEASEGVIFTHTLTAPKRPTMSVTESQVTVCVLPGCQAEARLTASPGTVRVAVL